MYSTRPGLIIGFHGCDESIRDGVLNGEDTLHHSKNSYDWLGNGIYFWENNLTRALNFSSELKKAPRKGKSLIKKPSVIGAVISLGRCLDLLDSQYLELLRDSHKLLEISAKTAGIVLPTNRTGSGTNELLLRDLDCLVIEDLIKRTSEGFDSVRGVFVEGNHLYPNSGFHEKNHIQICIRNPNCIKGYFLPRQSDEKFPAV